MRAPVEANNMEAILWWHYHLLTYRPGQKTSSKTIIITKTTTKPAAHVTVCVRRLLTSARLRSHHCHTFHLHCNAIDHHLTTVTPFPALQCTFCICDEFYLHCIALKKTQIPHCHTFPIALKCIAFNVIHYIAFYFIAL